MAAEVPVIYVASEDKNEVTISVTSPSAEPQTSGGGKAAKSQKKYLHDKDSIEYRQRRERNNVAVRKSRDKTRLKNQETLNKINELKIENERLVNKVELLSKELSVLKDLFLSNAEELPDPTTTFGLFNSDASSKLDTADPKIIASLGSKLVVANTIEVSVEGDVAKIVDGGESVQLPVPLANAIGTLASIGHQVVITDSSA